VRVEPKPAKPEDEGVVIEQDPLPDRRGTQITLGVGAESVVTPRVTGMTQEAATRALRRAGLTVGRVREKITDGRSIGRVRVQDPASGAAGSFWVPAGTN